MALCGIAARIIAIVIIPDLNNPEMWEFGIIARNLLAGLGFQHIAVTHNVVSAYMPPGQPYIYYFFFSLFGDNSTGHIIVLFVNIFVFTISFFVIFKISNSIYGKQTALLSAAYTAFSPVYIYSTAVFSPVIYYHLFSSLCFLFFMNSYSQNGNPSTKIVLKNVLSLALTMGIFLYFRAEMLMIILVFFAIYLSNKRIQHALMVIIIPLIIISPWTIRNYIVFGKIIPVSTSSGYNFYTGHGDSLSTIDYNRQINLLVEDSTFEIKKSVLSYDAGLKYIKSKPLDDFQESFSRLFDLWIIDRYRESSVNILYIIPWLLTLVLFVAGYYFSLKDKVMSSKLLYLKIFLIFVSLLVIVFFNIPRYQVQVSFIMIPTAMYALNIFFKRFNF